MFKKIKLFSYNIIMISLLLTSIVSLNSCAPKKPKIITIPIIKLTDSMPIFNGFLQDAQKDVTNILATKFAKFKFDPTQDYYGYFDINNHNNLNKLITKIKTISNLTNNSLKQDFKFSFLAVDPNYQDSIIMIAAQLHKGDTSNINHILDNAVVIYNTWSKDSPNNIYHSNRWSITNTDPNLFQIKTSIKNLITQLDKDSFAEVKLPSNHICPANTAPQWWNFYYRNANVFSNQATEQPFRFTINPNKLILIGNYSISITAKNAGTNTNVVKYNIAFNAKQSKLITPFNMKNPQNATITETNAVPATQQVKDIQTFLNIVSPNKEDEGLTYLKVWEFWRRFSNDYFNKSDWNMTPSKDISAATDTIIKFDVHFQDVPGNLQIFKADLSHGFGTYKNHAYSNYIGQPTFDTLENNSYNAATPSIPFTGINLRNALINIFNIYGYPAPGTNNY